MAEELIVTDLQVDLQKYQRALQTATRLAQDFDRQLINTMTTLNRLEKTANGLKPEIKVDVDTSTIDRAESDIKSIDGLTAHVDVDVDADQVSRAESSVKAIDGATPNVSVDTDTSSLDKAQGDLKTIDGATPDVAVQADTTELDGVKDGLENLQKLAVIQIALQVAPDAAELLGKVTGFSGQQDTQVARSTFATSTGGAEIDPGIIERVYSATGAAREEVAAAAAEIYNLTGNFNTLENDTLSAFSVAAGSGEEVTAVIRAQAQLVRNDLTPNFQTAADLLATGFNKNANRAGDFLDTILEYSPNFKAMGLTGEQAVSGITQALAVGTFNADKFGDVVKETGILINEALGDTTGTKYQILQNLDLVDEATLLNQGKIGFDEFFKGFKEASANLSPADRNTAITELFGTPAEDLGFDVFAGLDLAAPFEVAEGAAASLLDVSQNNLPAAFAELGRTFETEVINKMIDMQGLLDDVTIKIKLISELLRGGMALPEALEVALQAPGLAATVDQFASTANNLILEFLLGVSNILEGIGQKGAADDVRGYVTQASVGQLAFDIQVADDAVGVQNAISTAMRRGVDEAQISQALGTAVDDFIASGKIDEAYKLLETTMTSGLAEVAGGATYDAFSVPFEITPEMTPEQIDTAAREAVNEYVAGTGLEQISDLFKITPTMRDIDTTQAMTALQSYEDKIATIDSMLSTGDIFGALDFAKENNLQEEIDALTKMTESADTMAIMKTRADEWASAQDLATKAAQNTAKNGLPDLTTNLDNATTAAEDTTTAIKDTGLEVSILGVTVDEQMSNTAAILLAYALDMQDSFKLIEDAALAAGNAIGTVQTTGGGGYGGLDGDPATPWAKGGIAPAGFNMFGEAGREIGHTNTALAILNNQTTEAMLAGINMAMNGMIGGSTNSSVYNINVNVNNQGAAARAGNDSRIASMIRGY